MRISSNGNHLPVSTYKFNGFTLDSSRRLLLDKSSDTVGLTPKVFDLLLFLVRHAGEVKTKDEIFSAVWADSIVEESNLTQNVSILRRALGDVRGRNEFIATIPGQGYKFVAAVEAVVDEAAGSDPALTDVVSTVSKMPGRGPLYIAGGIAVVLFALGALYLFKTSRTDHSARPRVLAILPFQPIVADASDEALEMGMTDTLIARLSEVPGLVLRPLTSVRKFKEVGRDPLASGKDLGADSVLDGSLQRSGEQIRVNVRLIDVESGEALWSRTFDEPYNDIFTVQDAIANKVADELGPRIGKHTDPATRPTSTHNLEAYRLYLQARLYQFRSTPQDIRQAIKFYQDAINADPAYALAYAGVADAYRTLPITSDVAADEAFPQSKASAEKALSLDPDLPEAHIALGYVLSWYEWNWTGAEAEFRRAIQMRPNNSEAHRALSLLLTVRGRHPDAIAEMQTARELDPLSLPTNALEAQALFFAGRDDEAVDRLQKTFEIEPNFWIARLMLARIYIKQQHWDEALNELKRARDASHGNTESISLMGYVYARTGQRSSALKSLEDLQRATTPAYSPAYNIAMLQNGLGNKDAALASLDVAVGLHDVRLILLGIDHKWDDLRDEPRFDALIKRVGLK